MADMFVGESIAAKRRTPNTKGQAAYRVLRRAIVTMEVADDESLDEAQLMRRFDLGRTPLREALKRLAHEEFIVWPPHRSPHVRANSVEDLRSLYETRFLLEVPVARMAAERITAAELTALESLLDTFRDVNTASHLYESIELDHEIHLAIARGTHNRFLTDAVNRLNCGSLRLWYRGHRQSGLGDATNRHSELVEPLRRHDPRAAETAARQHIELSLKRQLALSNPAFEFSPAPAGGISATTKTPKEAL